MVSVQSHSVNSWRVMHSNASSKKLVHRGRNLIGKYELYLYN